MILNKYGLEKALYICAGLFFLRFIISLIMAPETKNMSLTEASSLNESGSQKKSTSYLDFERHRSYTYDKKG